MSEKKYVPATPDSSVAKKWVNHLNAQVRKGGDIGVYSGNKNKEIIVPTSANDESNAQVNLARGFFSFYIDTDNNMLYVYDSLFGWQNGEGICGYSIVGDRSIPVPEAKFPIITGSEIRPQKNDSMCIYVHHYLIENKDSTTVAAKIETAADFDYRFWSRACNFRLGRVKHDVLNGVHIYTPCYDVNVNPVVLG